MQRISIAAWLALGLVCGCTAGHPGGACRADKILNTGGLYISLASGQAYQAYPGAQAIMSTWLPQEKVTVCPIGGISVQITNLGQKGESVKAIRIYPQNTGGLI